MNFMILDKLVFNVCQCSCCLGGGGPRNSDINALINTVILYLLIFIIFKYYSRLD